MSTAIFQTQVLEAELEVQDDMPVSDSRFDKLVNKVENIAQDLSELAQRTSKLEGIQAAPQVTFQKLLWFLGLVIIAFSSFAGFQLYNLNSRISKIEGELSPDGRVGKLVTQLLDVRASKSPNAVLKEINELAQLPRSAE